MSLYPVDTSNTGCQVVVLTVIHSKTAVNFHGARILSMLLSLFLPIHYMQSSSK